MLFSGIKNIIFDFDGVILDSMSVRDKGFSIIFNKYPKQLVDQFLVYHRLNGGLSRFHKIRYFYYELLRKEISDEEVMKYAQSFSEVMREELVKPEYRIMDSIRFIEKYSQLFNFHIASGSEEKELKFLCESHGISQFFKSIHGSPTPKNEIVRNILIDYKYKTEQTVLIGDSINDLEAAKVNGIRFIGYNNQQLKGKGYLYVDKLGAIDFHIGNLEEGQPKDF